MATTKPELLTTDDLLRLYSQGVRGELILGVLCKTMPAGGEHGKVAALLISVLMNFVRPQRLGTVSGTDAGVLLQNGRSIVREPDIAYFSAETLPLDQVVSGYYEVVPDLVVEITSPGTTIVESNDKARMWLSYGVPLVWEIDPVGRTVNVHKTGVPIVTLTEDDTLDGGEVLPGFSCPLREIFEI